MDRRTNCDADHNFRNLNDLHKQIMCMVYRNFVLFWFKIIQSALVNLLRIFRIHLLFFLTQIIFLQLKNSKNQFYILEAFVPNPSQGQGKQFWQNFIEILVI